MALIEKTEKRVLRFNLHDAADRSDYEAWLNDPQVKVLDKRFEKMKESEFQEDFSTTSEEMWVYLEVEKCTL